MLLFNPMILLYWSTYISMPKFARDFS